MFTVTSLQFTATQELEIDICGSAPERGLCRGQMRRYFYDRTKGKCMLFEYGGCGGNMNNFITKELCVQRCGRNEGKCA